MPCVTHHDACECRMEIVRELVKVLLDDALCLYCCGTNEECPACKDLRELRAKVGDAGWL